LPKDIREHYEKCPAIGAALLGEMPGTDEIVRLVECHAENFDGSGFPRDAIPIGARIIRLAYAYDTYLMFPEDGKGREYAIQYIAERRGKIHDPALFKYAMAYLDELAAEESSKDALVVAVGDLREGMELAESLFAFADKGLYLAVDPELVSIPWNLLLAKRRCSAVISVVPSLTWLDTTKKRNFEETSFIVSPKERLIKPTWSDEKRRQMELLLDQISQDRETPKRHNWKTAFVLGHGCLHREGDTRFRTVEGAYGPIGTLEWLKLASKHRTLVVHGCLTGWVKEQLIGDMSGIPGIALMAVPGVVRRRQAWRVACGAIDIDGLSTPAADQVVVVVADPILVARRRASGLDPADDALLGQEAECVVDCLSGYGANLGAYILGDFVRRTMGPPRHRPQHGNTLGRDMDLMLPKEFGGVVGHGENID